MTFNLLFSFLLVNLSIATISANGGVFETYIEIAIDNNTGFFYGTGGGTPNFNNAVLVSNLNPNTQSFEILTRGVNTWNDNGTDVQSARLNYRIYNQGNTPGSFIIVNLPFIGQNGNDKFWNTNIPPIDLLTSVTTAGTYVVEIFWEATTNDVNCGNCSSGILYENNGGTNFIATFTTSVALPVELMSFGVDQKENDIHINWSTTNEINNDGYIILHSIDGENFNELAKIIAYNEISSKNDYEFVDQIVSNGLNYYKLLQVDYDGHIYQLGVRHILISHSFSLELYPNPASQTINIRNSNDHNQEIEFYNSMGQLALSSTISKSLDISSLASGIYVVKISDGNVVSKRIFISN